MIFPISRRVASKSLPIIPFAKESLTCVFQFIKCGQESALTRPPGQSLYYGLKGALDLLAPVRNSGAYQLFRRRGGRQSQRSCDRAPNIVANDRMGGGRISPSLQQRGERVEKFLL